ncbi:MAG TPA: glycosyltransferase [Candidatus Dormibacteraeota bacterium]|nr:glycosyltransferase [Candidatus Dormibacteraeota bacterium]
MKKPLVSIVIPSYNHSRFLTDAVNSALAQTYRPLEVIVVDDGSTDNTADIAKKFGSKISYIRQTNQGPSAARNKGVAAAKGEYLLFLDADDLLEPGYIEQCLEALAANPQAAYVYTQMKLFGRQNHTTHYPPFDLKKLTKGNFIHIGVLIPTELVRKFPFDPKFRQWEDWDLYLTLAENGYYGHLLDKPLLNYRKHPEKESLIDTLGESLELEKKMLFLIINKHPKLYGPTAKPVVLLKLFLRRRLPFLVPSLKRLIGRSNA